MNYTIWEPTHPEQLFNKSSQIFAAINKRKEVNNSYAIISPCQRDVIQSGVEINSFTSIIHSFIQGR